MKMTNILQSYINQDFIFAKTTRKKTRLADNNLNKSAFLYQIYYIVLSHI